MSYLLSVRVKRGRLQAAAGGGKTSGYNTLLSLRVGDVEGVTRPMVGTAPAWGQELHFNVQSPLEVLEVTLQNKGWFSKDNIASCSVPLYDMPFGEQLAEGRWFELTQAEEKTGHQILLELHFDVEPGLSAKEAARHWKMEYVRVGGTASVDISSEEDAQFVDDDSEDGRADDGGEYYQGGEVDEYTSEDEDDVIEEKGGDVADADSEDAPSGDYAGDVGAATATAGEVADGFDAPRARARSSRLTRTVASLPNVLAGGVAGAGHSGETTQPSSLIQPSIIESVADNDFDRGSSASCHSNGSGDAPRPERRAYSSEQKSKRRKLASKRRTQTHRTPSINIENEDDAARGRELSQQDAQAQRNMRTRADALSEGSPYASRGTLLRSSTINYSGDDECGPFTNSSHLPSDSSPPPALSPSDVAIDLNGTPMEDSAFHEASGGASEHVMEWGQAADTVFKQSTLPRDQVNSGVFAGNLGGNPAVSQFGSMFEFQVAPPKSKYRKSFVTKNVNAQEAVKKRIALMKRRNVLLCNEQLQIHVYHKTIQALLYPLSDNKEHEVELVTFHKPAHCYECGSLLWGLAKQGMKCTACGIKCHRRCLELLNADCLQRAAERYAKQGDVDKNRHFKRIMDEKISRRQKESNEVFECIREVFNVPKKQHEEVMVNAKQSILEGLSVWSAKVKVTVIEATGLTAKDKATGTSDPYVTIQVGEEKLKTSVVHQNLNPKWNETFDFECHESSDRIKVRVWDQDRDIKAAIANALTKEPDDFLGQTIIEVYSLSGEMDVWYTLDRRGDRSPVSGSIHLWISVEVEGEEKKAPFHVQYTSLHETTFDYLDQEGDHLQMMRYTQAPDRSLLFFKKPALDIIQEFALRYGIENIYQIMTHFSCLTMRYATPGMTQTLSRLLVLVNGYFRDHATVTQMGDGSLRTSKQPGRFLASNFKKEKFVEVLDRLQENLIYDLNAYRDVFPADQQDKLDELKCGIDLITSIMFFRQKVLSDPSTFKAKDLVVECVQASIMSTFQIVREETMMFVAQGGVTDAMVAAAKEADTSIPKQIPGDEERGSGKGVNEVTYLFRMTELLAQMVEQDRDIYSKYICQFRDVDMGELSALFLWELFFEDLAHQLSSPEVINSCSTFDFINLLFKTKWFFETYVVKCDCDQLAMSKKIHRVFAPFIRSWLLDMVEKFDDILKIALEKDEERQFKQLSEHNLHSTSVLDIFSALTECLNVLKKVGCTDADIQGDYDQLYASMVVRVLTKFTTYTKDIFTQRIPEPVEACMLMNNAEQLRLRLEKLYKHMGGELIENTAAGNALNDLQSVLKQDQDDLCMLLAKGLDDMILSKIKTIPTLLARFKTGGEPSNSEVHRLIEPGFQVMEKRIKVLVEKSSKTIVRRVLKELYRIMLTHLLENVVLPPLSSIRAQGRDHDLMDLTSRQWKVLTKCLEGLQEFFHVESHGLKQSYMKSCPERKRIDEALSMYTLSTEMLLSRFVYKEREQDKLAVEEPLGFLNVQVDIFETQAERKVTVKVVSASQLQWPTTVSGIFRPFVEITLFGPALVGGRHKQETKSKTKSPAIYNETFSFSTSREYDIDVYELHLTVRDYCFGRKAALVGVTTLPLREVMQSTGSLMARLSIGQSLEFSDAGADILCVLAQRPEDELSLEFVNLKLESRTVDFA